MDYSVNCSKSNQNVIKTESSKFKEHCKYEKLQNHPGIYRSKAQNLKTWQPEFINQG